MARPKAFDEDIALEKALQAFWFRGYQATSIQDLTHEMSINRASLYNTYGDKHALYVAALDRYSDRMISGWMKTLTCSHSPRAAIRQIFQDAVVNSINDEQRRGCLIVNAAVELSAHDAEVDNRVARNLNQLEEAFHDALCRLQQAGGIHQGRDIRALARFLVNNLEGLFVMAKATPDRELLQDIAAVTLSILD